MREIKVRGYSEGYKKWIYGWGVVHVKLTEEFAKEVGKDFVSYIYSDHGNCEVVTDSVGEFTGLKDKNGREIYEGDIVNFVDFDTTGGHRADREYRGVVKYQSGIYEIWKNNDSEFFDSDGAFILNHAWLQDDEFEVIGNIYENPELIKGVNA